MPQTRFKLFGPAFNYMKENAVSLFVKLLPLILVYFAVVVAASFVPMFEPVTQPGQFPRLTPAYRAITYGQSLLLTLFTASVFADLFKAHGGKPFSEGIISYILRTLGIGALSFVIIGIPVIVAILALSKPFSLLVIGAAVLVGIIFLIRLTFYIPSSMDKKPLSFKEAWEVTRGHGFYIFSSLFLLGLLVIGIVIAIAIPLAILGYVVYGANFVDGGSNLPLWMELFFEFVGLVATVYSAAFLFRLYMAVVHKKGEAK